MSSVGHRAEDAVATWLRENGYKILAQNWRNKYGEIDIVAQLGPRVHIVEVKYRYRPDSGDGFEHITDDKIRRLRRAAMAWSVAEDWSGDMQIDVASVSGSDMKIDYLESAVESND